MGRWLKYYDKIEMVWRSLNSSEYSAIVEIEDLFKSLIDTISSEDRILPNHKETNYIRLRFYRNHVCEFWFFGNLLFNFEKSVDSVILDKNIWANLIPILQKFPYLTRICLNQIPFNIEPILSQIHFLKNIKEISISPNSKTTLDPSSFSFDSFKCLKYLTHIILSNIILKEIPVIFKDLKSLKELRLNNCDILEIPPWITQIPKLNNLELDGNHINQIPKLERKIWMRLSNNNLTSFAGFDHIDLQSSFQFEHNPITTLYGLDKYDYVHLIQDFKDNLGFQRFPHKSDLFFGFNLTTTGRQLMDDVIYHQDDTTIAKILEYYEKSPTQLTDELLELKNLSEEDIERLIHEISWQDRLRLENHLDVNHPVMRALLINKNELSLTNNESLLL